MFDFILVQWVSFTPSGGSGTISRENHFSSKLETRRISSCIRVTSFQQQIVRSFHNSAVVPFRWSNDMVGSYIDWTFPSTGEFMMFSPLHISSWHLRKRILSTDHVRNTRIPSTLNEIQITRSPGRSKRLSMSRFPQQVESDTWCFGKDTARKTTNGFKSSLQSSIIVLKAHCQFWGLGLGFVLIRRSKSICYNQISLTKEWILKVEFWL